MIHRWYQFDCGDYQIGSSSKSSYTCKNGAIADTGTTLMLHDSAVVDAYWKANGGTNSRTYGKDFTLNPVFLLIRLLSNHVILSNLNRRLHFSLQLR